MEIKEFGRESDLLPEEIDKSIAKAKKEGKCPVPQFVDITEETLDRLAEQIAWVANRFNGIHNNIKEI